MRSQISTLYILLISVSICLCQTNPNELDSLTIIDLGVQGGSSFGGDVAIFKDQHAVVGAPFEKRAFIFTDNSKTLPWHVRHILYPDEYSFLFGSSVDATDKFVVVGDWLDNEQFSSAGAVHIYQKTNSGGFSKLQKIVLNHEDSLLYFGTDVSIYRDYLVVSNGRSNVYNKEGGIHIYHYNGIKFTKVESFVGGFSSLVIPVDIDSIRVVAGDPNDSSLFPAMGRVVTYLRNGVNWNWEQDLYPANPMSNMHFGKSLAVDGNRIVIGLDSSALLFQYVSTTWLQLQELIPPGSNASSYGQSVDMTDDSIWVAESYVSFLFTNSGGVWSDNGNTHVGGGVIQYKGGGYVISNFPYVDVVRFRPSGSYSEIELSDDDDFYCEPGYCEFSTGVSIADDALMLGSDHAIWIYQKNDTGWFQTTMFQALGDVVAMMEDRAIFRSRYPSAPNFEHSLLVAEKSGESWVVTSVIDPPEFAEGFGDAFAADGDWLAVGAPQTGPGSYIDGRVYLYHWNGMKYDSVQTLYPDDESWFGSSISIKNDLLAIGAPFDGLAGEGRVYVYVNYVGSNQWTQIENLVPDDNKPLDNFGSSVTIHDSLLVVGASGADYNTGDNKGAVYIFKKDGLDYEEIDKLEDIGLGNNSRCGSLVDLEFNNLLIACPGFGENVYHFKYLVDHFDKVDSFEYNAYEGIDINNENFVLSGEDNALVGQTSTSCFGHLLITGNINPTMYKAENRISSTGTVQTGAVIFSSPEIELRPDFEAITPAIFKTNSEGCD